MYYLVLYVLQLHDRDPYQPVVREGAVVLHRDVELVRGDLLLVADYAMMGNKGENIQL